MPGYRSVTVEEDNNRCLCSTSSLTAATEDLFKTCESSVSMNKTKTLNEMNCSGKNINEHNRSRKYKKNNDHNYFQNCLCIQAVLLLHIF